MKNFYLITISLLIVASFVSGQNSNYKYQIGIEGGPSLSAIRYNAFFFPSKYCDIGPGGMAGLVFQYSLTEEFGIKAILSYERLTLSEADLIPDYWWNYIALPVLGQLDFGRSKRFYAELGPFFGYALSMTESDYYRKFNCGLTVGIGARFPISNQFYLTFGIRNNLGLYNISNNLTYLDKHGDPVTEIENRYTSSTAVILGIIYSQKKKK